MTDQNNAPHNLSTSSGGRAYLAEYFATQLRRHDFARYIENMLAADFACTLAQHLSELRAPVASAEVMDALNWVDDFIARCNGDDVGACESVNVLRRALASAPVAGGAQPVAKVADGGPWGPTLRFLATGKPFPKVGTMLYAAPQASEAVLEAIQFVLKNFKASEAQGYHTRDRQFAISILEQALSAQPGAQRTGGSDGQD